MFCDKLLDNHELSIGPLPQDRWAYGNQDIQPSSLFDSQSPSTKCSHVSFDFAVLNQILLQNSINVISSSTDSFLG